MPDLEKERKVVLVIESAQLELKKIIQQGILIVGSQYTVWSLPPECGSTR